MNSKHLKIFSEKYGLVILFILQLQNGPIYSKITRDVKKFLFDGYNDQTSVEMTLNKNFHLLEDLWNEKDTDSEEEEYSQG